ncbi:MAG: TIGR02757 family protein [Deltaproteobacteria bacterium]|nr:TIGR02757 family protein [Deltaproteobacteria bacterium]
MNTEMKDKLEQLYLRYNRREFIHPDPLEFVYLYKDSADREIVALIASSLAYGRVGQILKSVAGVLAPMVPSPSVFVAESSLETIQKTLCDFKHRFATGDHLASLLSGIKQVLKRYGSLHACFMAGMSNDDTVLPALAHFAAEVTAYADGGAGHLVPSPDRGSACKRLNLFLRWMVRSDDVDPGEWESVSPSKLIVPLDTHMHRISLSLGLTRRKQANMATAKEITEAFRQISPEDPVKYDFALTRLGMKGDEELAVFLNE